MEKINSEHGSFLIGALVFVIILAIVIFSATTLVTSQNRAQVQSANERKAFYAAETGIEYALGALKDSMNWRAAPSNVSVGDGKFSLTLDDNNTTPGLGDTLLVSSVGTVGNIQRSIQLVIKLPPPPKEWPFVFFAPNLFELDEGYGTIKGDIHTNSPELLKINYVTHDIQGDVTTAPPAIDVPTINWQIYKDAAIADSHYYTGSYTFNEGQTYKGHYYIEGTAEFNDNVTIIGSLVTGDHLNIFAKNVKFIADPPNWPVIATKQKIRTDGADYIYIEGFVYCDHFHWDAHHMTFIGSCVAITKIHSCLSCTSSNDGQDKKFIFDPKYTTDIVGMDFKLPDPVYGMKIVRWKYN